MFEPKIGQKRAEELSEIEPGEPTFQPMVFYPTQVSKTIPRKDRGFDEDILVQRRSADFMVKRRSHCGSDVVQICPRGLTSYGQAMNRRKEFLPPGDLL